MEELLHDSFENFSAGLLPGRFCKCLRTVRDDCSSTRNELSIAASLTTNFGGDVGKG